MCFTLAVYAGCRGLIASHYHQLGKLADRVTGVGSYKVVADHNKGGLIFTYRVMVYTYHRIMDLIDLTSNTIPKLKFPCPTINSIDN